MAEGRWTPEEGERIDRIFAQVLEMPPGERDAHLEELRTRDPDTATVVERLLEAAENPDPRLDPTRWGPRGIWGRLTDLPAPEARHGERVGPWRILEEVGRGGMSVVYLAERADGLFEQRVAFKFLRVAHEVGLRRFEQERRILAGLEHPNIGRLLDGGTDDRGRPYIVMEHVQGQRIDAWCRTTGATLEERLDLVSAVAGAVEYAHRNLVVHRDLKPSNILVTRDGHVKLLDFGIARLLEAEGAEESGAESLTRTMVRLLTPEYASPEQVRGERITTASDVYQLGVILYELLAGRRPFTLDGAGAAEIERVICDEEPPPPSAVATLEGKPPGRVPDERALRRKLRGDLDTIVGKAMAREPERRYGTVGELRDDLARFRAGLPVRARRPTLRYRASRFLRRHRVGVVATLLVVLSLLGGLAAASWQAVVASGERDRAELARAQAETVTDFLVEVFEVSDPERSRGEEVTARELLDRGAQRAVAGLDDPEITASLLGVIGRAYRSLGLYDAAEPLLEGVVELFRGELRDTGDERGLAAGLAQLGRLRMDQRRLDEADALYAEALEIRRRIHGGEHEEIAESLRDLSTLRHLQGDMGAAEELARETLEMRRRLFGNEHPAVAAARTDLGRVHLFQGNLAAADEEFSDAIALHRRLGSTPDRTLAASLNHLGQVRHNQGRYDEAEELYGEAHQILLTLLGPDHPQTADVYNNLGTLLYARGQIEEAVGIFREVLAARRATLAEDHPLLAHTLHNLASMYQVLDRFDEAEEQFRQALEIRRSVYGERHRDVAMTRWGLGYLLRRMGRMEESEEEVLRALATYRETLPGGHATLGAILVDYGSFLLERGRPGEAETHLEEGLAIRRALYAEEDQRVVVARDYLEEARQAAGRTAELDG